MPDTSFEHVLGEDGRITRRILDGPMKGASATEKRYAAVRVGRDVHALSYLAASGHTLTVVLDFESKRMFGFGSNEKEWFPVLGTFEVVD